MHTIDSPGFYEPFDNNDFKFERCFLCGCDFDNTKLTDEHIFPKWLLHRFNLFNETLTLLNGSTIPYRLLVVPCCADCNGVHLSQMEDRFLALLNRNFEGLTEFDEVTIFQWTAKVLYGTLYKELSLLLDRRNPDQGRILTPDVVERFRTLHMLLQSIRIHTEFSKPLPWSIFVSNYDDDEFHYINDIVNQCFSIKFGAVGVSIAFEECGAVGVNLRWMHYLNMFKLNQLQFIEASAIIFYGKRLMTNSITYLTAYSMSQKMMTITPTNRPRGREWDKEEYAAFLEAMFAMDGYENVGPLYKGGTVRTWLVDNSGQLMMDVIKNSYNDDFGIPG